MSDKTPSKSFLAILGDFLFGKAPDIFDDKGNVYHEHPKKKWDDWHNRLKYNPNYNWRQHMGTRTGTQAVPLNSGSTNTQDKSR